ncbi:MAG: hypothetical protein CL755_12565 [Chloroflexi bacterium]|nr:hypothetical protein [Chloroflexota bacterium]|tara:strand:+ start:2070 stop:2456 length:387 start_codon:yes stop_codon:yes gene_type:complete
MISPAKINIIDRLDEWAQINEVDLQYLGGSLTNCPKEIREEIERFVPAILGVSDGYWTTEEYDDRIAVMYDEDKVIEIISEDMEPCGDPDDPDDEYNNPHFLAREYFDYNVKGGWHGDHTPIFIQTFK